MRFLVTLIVAAFCSTADARMYQWNDPDTGTPQLSGKPPYWYRGSEQGPRIYVIENGQVVDDTAVEKPESEKQRLREEAFTRAEQDASRAQRKLEQAEHLKSEAARKQSQAETARAELLPDNNAVPDQPELQDTEADKGPSEEEMRALIEQWEQMRSEKARQLLGEGETPSQ